MAASPTLSYASPTDSWAKTALIRTVETLTGQRTLQRLYDATRSAPGDSFWTEALDTLDVSLCYNRAALAALPDEGPLVVVANHPFGVLDGLALCHLISQVRSTFRLLINSVLCRDERFDAHFLPIDFGDTRDARRTNVRTLRTALHTLEDDGAVVVFPAGGIATAPTWFGPAEDLDWKPSAAKLVASSEATVVPVYVSGQNSRLFHWASRISLTLRLALIIREVMNKRGETLTLRIGASLPYAALPDGADGATLTAHLRDATFALAES